MNIDTHPSFNDRDAVSSYAARTSAIVPAVGDLHTMAGLLLAEGCDADAEILVLGAGGGLELKAFADMHPRWRFVGVDPSSEMLDLARATVGHHASRVALHLGLIDDAPQGLFDGAACLLTLHFLDQDTRLQTLQTVASRLKPGAPFVMAHYSFPTDGDGAERWFGRAAAYAGLKGQNHGNIAAMKERLPILSPEMEVSLLQAAGFTGIELFYAALAFRGWIARKA